MKCQKKGGTFKELMFDWIQSKAFKETYFYECDCGKWHVTGTPK